MTEQQQGEERRCSSCAGKGSLSHLPRGSLMVSEAYEVRCEECAGTGYANPKERINALEDDLAAAQKRIEELTKLLGRYYSGNAAFEEGVEAMADFMEDEEDRKTVARALRRAEAAESRVKELEDKVLEFSFRVNTAEAENARLRAELDARLEKGLSANEADWQMCFDAINANATIYRSADGKSHMSYSGMAVYVTKAERDRDRLREAANLRLTALLEMREDRDRLQRIVDEMATRVQQFKCWRCGGSGHEEVYDSGGMTRPCPVCGKTGLHPIAREALNAAAQAQAGESNG